MSDYYDVWDKDNARPIRIPLNLDDVGLFKHAINGHQIGSMQVEYVFVPDKDKVDFSELNLTEIRKGGTYA